MNQPTMLLTMLLHWTFLAATSATAADMTADELLAAIDHNMVFATRETDMTMVIDKDGKKTEKKLHLRSRGYETSFAEFLAPARDKGTRYLKLEKNLWMWLPDAEKQVKISGHMLRQSLMGSDFSYEDMLESPDLSGRYDATVVGPEEVGGRPCVVLLLKAKEADNTYPTRKVWIDKELYIPVKEELYALTGKVMKEEYLHDPKQFTEKDAKGSERTRWFPTRIVMKNLLQKGTQTEVTLSNVSFGVALPDEVFSIQNLGKGQ